MQDLNTSPSPLTLALFLVVPALLVVLIVWGLFQSGGGDAVPAGTPQTEQDDYATLRQWTVELVETYTLIKPEDTPQDRQERVEGLEFMKEQDPQLEPLRQLVYEFAPSQCGDAIDQLRLTEKAVVDPLGMTIVPSTELNPYTYVNVPYKIALFTDDGRQFPGSEDCPAEAEPTITTLWSGSNDDGWQLITVYPPEIVS